MYIKSWLILGINYILLPLVVESLYLVFCHIVWKFLNFQLPVKNVEFNINQSRVEIRLPEVFKIHTEKMIKRGHTSCLHAKWLFCFRMPWHFFFPKNVSCMGRGIPQGYNNNISRLAASFMINRTQLKFKNHWFLGLEISTLYQEK